jgi:hypothetical protein
MSWAHSLSEQLQEPTEIQHVMGGGSPFVYLVGRGHLFTSPPTATMAPLAP